ncbi:MAG: ATP-binding cassette domain-containing protein [Bacteroidota bacterium]
MLTVDAVTKRYGSFTAVNAVSFEAQPGRILGLLGPNGAGKTSTIRMIAYITAPDKGAVRFEGKPVGRWSQERMGYLPEERGLYKKLKVGQQLEYLATLKGLTTADARQRAHQWLERLGGADWYDKRTDELSKGMQQKVQFISTIMHEPDLLILDEPFSGLDPINATLLTDVIQELKQDGRTLLFASHRLESVEQLCDDICLISQGQIVLDGGLREIKRRFGRDTVIVEFEGSTAFLDEIEQAGLAEVLRQRLHRAELRLRPGILPRQVLEVVLRHVDDVIRFESVEPPLNDIFVRVVQDQQGQEAIPEDITL